MGINSPNRFSASMGNAAQTREETNLSTLFEHLQTVPIVQGRLVKDVTTSTSGFEVPHGLGRTWQGFIVVKSIADINVWANSTQTNSNRYITLDASAASIVSLWVF